MVAYGDDTQVIAVKHEQTAAEIQHHREESQEQFEQQSHWKISSQRDSDDSLMSVSGSSGAGYDGGSGRGDDGGTGGSLGISASGNGYIGSRGAGGQLSLNLNAGL